MAYKGEWWKMTFISPLLFLVVVSSSFFLPSLDSKQMNYKQQKYKKYHEKMIKIRDLDFTQSRK